MNTVRVCLSILVAGTLVLGGCTKKEEPRKIDLGKRTELAKKSEGPERRIRVAGGGMITPKAGFGYYRQLLDYLQERLGMRVEYVDRTDYAEINDLVRTGNVDLAFVCGGPYVEGRRDFGMELLVAPQSYGRPVYYAYIIVPKDSTAAAFRDLRGKAFAFTDPISNTGWIVPNYMLAQMGETPDTFFRKYVFTPHDSAIKAVAQGIVDGASVNSLIWEYENRTQPAFTSQTKIIERSPPYGTPPVVVRKGLDPQLKERIRQVLLTAHTDEKGAGILKGMMIDKFIPISDSAYDAIRDMRARIAKQSKGKGT